MDQYIACEEAYKHGYEDGKKDAIIHGYWIFKKEIIRSPYALNYFRSNCKNDSFRCFQFCPNCGAKMDLDK